jgi:hypothetical protein
MQNLWILLISKTEGTVLQMDTRGSSIVFTFNSFSYFRASPRALQIDFALTYLQKRLENTPPMVLQLRFAIW